MRRKIMGICVCMLVLATALPAAGTLNKNIEKEIEPLLPPSVGWNLTYNRGEFDSIRDIQQTKPDGGYICCGLTEESNNFYILLLKLYANGTEEWHVVNYALNGTYVTSTEMDAIAFHVIQTIDGGFLVTGVSVISIEIQGETIWGGMGFLWKTTATGVTEWIEHYYSIEELAVDYIYYSLEIIGGYISTGQRIYFDMTGQVIGFDGFLMETDTNGNIIWIKTFDEGGNEHLSTLCCTNDGGYLLTGFRESSSIHNGALWIVKTNSTGDKDWEKTFDGPGFEYYYGKGCFQTSDNGYIICGNSGSYGAGSVDVWVIKTDSSGKEVWNKTYGYTHNDYTWCMSNTSNGDYVIVICKDYGYNPGTMDNIWIVEFNENGETECSYLIEETGVQIPTCIKQTDDSGFIISGRTEEYGISTSDGMVLKITPFPYLDIEVKGGLGIKATITNTGLGDAIGVPYEFTVKGGALGLINQTINGTIDILMGNQKSFSGYFFRFGAITISVKIGFKEKIWTAFLIGPFVLGIKEIEGS